MDLLEKAEFENLTKEERLRYESELKIFRDNYSAMEYAKTKGFENGFGNGFEQGKTEMILNGFAEGLSISMLSKISKLTEEEVIRIIEANK